MGRKRVLTDAERIEHRKEAQAKYQRKNKERLKEYYAKWYQENKENRKEYNAYRREKAKRKCCEYCDTALIDLYEADAIGKNILEIREEIFGEELLIEISIKENGNLVFFTNDRYFAEKKIKFCPMCGAEIPKITPTQAHRMGRDKDV